MKELLQSAQPETETRRADMPHGLTAAEVAARMERGEVNDFEPRVGRGYIEIIRDNVFNLFNVTLFTLLVIVFFFRDYATLFFAGLSVVTNSILGTIQEIQAKLKLEKLAALAAAHVRVWRDGQLRIIPIKQIVKDDVIVIEAGDRLVVDGMVEHSDSLELDESHLTGESDAVYKERGDPLSSGSFVVAGSGIMRATKVGRESTINKLAVVAKAYRRVMTPTQRRVAAFVELSVLIMFVIGPMLIIAGIVHGEGTPQQILFQVVKNAVVFVTSLVPQGLVLVTTISLTVGAISLSRHKTLIQRVNAVESMYHATVLCFDKTGTLTRNELTVAEIIPIEMEEGGLRRLLADYIGNLAHRNRTAQAIEASVGSQMYRQKRREIPFASARKWGAVVYQGETLLLGAPEVLLTASLDGLGMELRGRAHDLAERGYRVLALLRSAQEIDSPRIPSDARPIALIVLSDSVRDDIQETLQGFREQNVILKTISGDSLETVRAIAGWAGMPTDKAYLGDQLDAMSDAELEEAALRGDLFARVTPDTKRRLVAALKRRGHYVAMVGDGVNDVPALKEANLAIVMNDGAQIAKDVADIILLNNAMTTLPRAFREGRAITQTIYGTTRLFLSKNAYATLLFIFVAVMSLPFPITPIQISWVTFGTANIHAGLYALNIIRPRPMHEFRRDVLDYVLTSGLLGAVYMALLYFLVYISGSLNEARSAITLFTTLYGLLVFWHTQGIDLTRPRTLITYKWSTLIAGGFAVLTMLALYAVPSLFEFVPPSPLTTFSIVVLFVSNLMLLEMAMRGRRHVKLLARIFEP